MYLLVLCGVVILIWYLQFLWQNRRLYWYSYKTPGPIGLPFIGIAYKFLTRDISATTLGLNMNIQNSEEVEFITALEKLMEIISVRMLHVWHQLRFTWRLYPMSREFDKAFKIAKDFSSTLIANTKRKYESTRGNSSFEDDIALAVQGKHRDGISFLDLIYKNTKFTEQEITDEINTFLIAATDTTASGLCSIFTMLGMFQDIQQKVFEELIDILGPDRRAFPDDLPQLKYLERVVKESLRLFPPVPLIGRTLHEDIDGGDMIFPSRSSVIFGAVFIHRNPVYWPDPLKFDPDRFLPENTAKRHPCSYIPFSYGPRNCIGAKYAMMNMKTVLSAVLRKYKIFTEYKSVEEIKLSTSLILRLRDGPKVWIELR
ncbi:cytochrome P450 4C1-like isoform X14 [Diabrotica virgifera virgifera]|uniref:Cytochrome P450 4C1-like n=1 Tax=Diabrotica virgifera virgifera TaxID=50390 RepID=A0ABM5JZ22_DIAVI|nr:cytochrome P450 4C1-like isoform X14 [Diabrotica virgifera virgifera]